MLELLTRHGIGEITQPNELPARRMPWVFDSGAFAGLKAGRAFNAKRYWAAIARIASERLAPAWVVAPDSVGDWAGTVALAMDALPRLRRELPGVPVYLVAQDGGTEQDAAWASFDGVFVGGSLRWKLRTGATWAAFAHRTGRPCHVGRVGQPRRVKWARRIGADSIDSCFPLWTVARMAEFLRAVRGEPTTAQMSMFE